ncbi:Hypothetical predicted protein [Paramuricea clavata]|uniref:Uncharacterized protein n=1 Tax=Paramuricea clavata TaxID=317549 RepID=A0A6S7L0K6_PARCT|nr:Hypothetical predicted protein [Paramuricea clavata]
MNKENNGNKEGESSQAPQQVNQLPSKRRKVIETITLSSDESIISVSPKKRKAKPKTKQKGIPSKQAMTKKDQNNNPRLSPSLESDDEMYRRIDTDSSVKELLLCEGLSSTNTEENATDIIILQVDPTFDLGPFHVTATQFQNLHLVDRRSGKPPAMVGPLYIHRQKKEMTYEGFVNQLLEIKPELKSIKAIGTDGEEALSNAFVKKIDNIIHLRCFRHERQNID